ncbi:MAG TPA: phospholipase D family protein [Bacteroidia bacterium]|nr:phospholipase D family protein [Bacteroidia bacterium]HRD40465.1 phospholipase D family protein [Bacteroidia bacterium]
MAEFLTTTGTSHNIEQIIINSKDTLILVSPYLQLSKTLFERLKDASNRNTEITIIYGKDELKPNEKNSLAELSNLRLLYFENLHAKCYCNDNNMVITSMNMYEFSEKNNREMGVLIDKERDKELYQKAFAEIKSIIGSSDLVSNKKTERNFPPNQTNEPIKTNTTYKITNRGYCIRCEARIPLNPNKPLCGDCYASWAHYENPDYEENVCHSCGEYQDTSMNKPFCYTCFKKLKDTFSLKA